MYLNVYAVTRHYGGPEEGGWWYNAGQPLASVPIKAVALRGHDSSCHTCNQARAAASQAAVTGEASKVEFCRELPADYALVSDPSDHMTDEYEEYAARYGLPPEAYHLEPLNKNEVEKHKQELVEIFADEKSGNIYSVRGGVDIEIQLEEHMACSWPSRRPRYE